MQLYMLQGSMGVSDGGISPSNAYAHARRCVSVCVCVSCVGAWVGDVRRSLPEEMGVRLRCTGFIGVHWDERNDNSFQGKGQCASEGHGMVVHTRC